MADGDNLISVDSAIFSNLVNIVNSMQQQLALLSNRAPGGTIPSTGPPGSGVATGQVAPSQIDGVEHDHHSSTKKRLRTDYDNNDDDNEESADELDDTPTNGSFSPSELANAFLETTFKSKPQDLERQSKMAKFGILDSRWTCSPLLDPFIASSHVVRKDNAAAKTQRLWLEATAPLVALLEMSDIPS